MSYRALDPGRILETAQRLEQRIHERFPEAGLSRVARELRLVSAECVERGAYLARPNRPLRVAVLLLIVAIVVLIGMTLLAIRLPANIGGISDFVQALDAAVNDIVFVGIGIFFLLTLETRLKRRRALKAIHELRSIAHLVDMHQLTKDPDRILSATGATKSSPQRNLTPPELTRYLDYCSELLSLTGKIAALYVQNFADPVVLGAVTEVEGLATALSNKIWQKIMILDTMGRREA